MAIEIYLNTNGEECVVIQNEDGTIWSGYKSVYDEQQKALKDAAN